MNASAPAVSREDEVQSEIRKVRTFGRNARVLCAAFLGFGLVGSVGALILIVLGPFPGPNSGNAGSGLVGLDGVALAQLTTPQLKLWAVLVVGTLTSVGLATVYQLYRLFGNLAAGAIYTPENVRRVRRVGIFWLLMAVLGIVIPVASAALVAFGFLDASISVKHQLVFPSTESLSSLVAAGLILLASWIMDVGLYAKDHADTLQRDADLVI